MTRKELIKELEEHKMAIGKERDKLRKLIDEIEPLARDTDDAVEYIQSAINALSELT